MALAAQPTAATAPRPCCPASDEEALELFRSFLRIRTVSALGVSSGSYGQAVAFLRGLCQKWGLLVRTVESTAGKPVLLASWEGQDPNLPSLLLNSHYDVVPVFADCWEHDPWEAEIHDGRVYGRGAQDMKCVCIQYLVAISRLQGLGYVPQRTVHLTFVPDEEIGGAQGMFELLESTAFSDLGPIAVALDEGLANEGDAFTVFHGERLPWWIMVRAEGPTGHGSRFIANTATQKLLQVANKALQYRAEQEQQLGHGSHGCKHGVAKKLGDVTTVNLTMLRSGLSVDEGETWALNVIPTTAEAGFDVRLPPSLKPKDFAALLDEWCGEDGVTWQLAPWTRGSNEHFVTPIDDTNPWWAAFRDCLVAQGHTVEAEVFPAATDSRFLRTRGIPAFGFSPMKNCPILLHEHNEYLPVDVFEQGIEVYQKLIEALSGRLPSEPSCRGPRGPP